MHDCPKIQEKILDLVFNEIDPSEQKQLLDDAMSCALCRAELESFEKTLGLYDRAAAFNELTNAEWQAFENKLHKQFVKQKSVSAAFWQQMVFGTVRVPTPVLAVAALFVCGWTFFALRPAKNDAPEQITAESAQPTVAAPNSSPVITENGESQQSGENSEETVVVREVERVVTKKIYIVKKANPPKQRNATVAETPLETDSSPLNLAEFKPVSPAVTPSAVKENKP